MVKCVVSGCPNRVANVDAKRGILKRPPKRFFNFPEDPARVKVWLAALRETDKQDSTVQHLICEDHFLPDDITTNGVSNDAIPIMPPCLDGSLGMISPWGAESSEEEEQQDSNTDEGDDEGGDDGPADTELPAPEVPSVQSQLQDSGAEESSQAKMPTSPPQSAETTLTESAISGQEMPLGELTQRVLELMMAAPDSSLDIRHVTSSLQTCRKRICDITRVLEGISLIEKQSVDKFKWIGSCQISSFLRRNQQMSQTELGNLKLVEDTLDSLIKSCAQQLFDITDDMENAASAYVTHGDISRLAVFKEQTVIVIKAPDETKLEVPPPTEESIQVHLKGGKGPITVVTCDIGTRDVTEEKCGCLLTLEESRIKTAVLHRATS